MNLLGIMNLSVKIHNKVSKIFLQRDTYPTRFVFLLLVLVFLIFGTGISAASIYVPDDYIKIQWAIDNATTGDMIIIRDGVYIENLNVDKTLTLTSENGSANCIIKAANTSGYTFNITADGVTISGFTIEGALVGIYISADNCNITENVCFNNNYGILFMHSNNNTITNNNLSYNDYGILAAYSDNNYIADDNFTSNKYSSILLHYSVDSELKNNIMFGSGIYIRGDSLTHYTHKINTSNSVNGKPVYYWKDVSGIVPAGAGEIILVNCTDVVVKNQNLDSAGVGMMIVYSSTINITNNSCSYNRYGILLRYSSDNVIAKNNCSSNNDGIYLHLSSNNLMANNTVFSNNESGIYIDESFSNILNNNIVSSNNKSGILIVFSTNTTVKTNDVRLNNGKGIEVSASNDTRIAGNSIYLNKGDGIYIWSSHDNNISDNNISLNDKGIEIGHSNDNVIAANSVSGSEYEGISITTSNNTSLIGNSIFSSDWDGMSLYDSNNSVIMNNTLTQNDCGILLDSSFANMITNNTALNNIHGICVFSASSNNSITNNNASSNSFNGIYLSWNSNNNLISKNEVVNNKKGIRFNFSCSYNSIISNTILNNDYGIFLFKSTNNGIASNKLLNNGIGIKLWNASSNEFIHNNISYSDYSFYLEFSENNQMYLNNIDKNAHSSNSDNFWNSTKMIIYMFNGSMHMNYLGNYWNDYAGVDTNSDGTGEIPYIINTSGSGPEKDLHPLVYSSENFNVIKIPDLTIKNVIVPKMDVGKNYVIIATISNTGTEGAHFNVSLDTGVVMKTKTLQLDPRQSANLTFNCTFQNPGSYSIKMSVDPDNSISEFNETNNNVSITVNVLSQPSASQIGRSSSRIPLKPPFIAAYEYYESFVRSFNANETLVIAIPIKLEQDIGVSEIGASINKSMLGNAAISKVKSLPEGMVPPEGKVYTYFEFVCTQYGTLNKVEASGYLKFRISKEWLSNEHSDIGCIKLLKHKSNKWIEIPIELVNTDGGYYYFLANLESFSIFSIVLEVTNVNITTPTPNPTPVLTPIYTLTPYSTPTQVTTTPTTTPASPPASSITPALTKIPETTRTAQSASSPIGTGMIVTAILLTFTTAVLLYILRKIKR